MDSSHKNLLTITDVAAAFEVSWPAVNTWIRRGELPYIVLPGGRRKVRREDLNEFLTPRRATDTK